MFLITHEEGGGEPEDEKYVRACLNKTAGPGPGRLNEICSRTLFRTDVDPSRSMRTEGSSKPYVDRIDPITTLTLSSYRIAIRDRAFSPAPPACRASDINHVIVEIREGT